MAFAESASGIQQTLRRNPFTVKSIRTDFVDGYQLIYKVSPSKVQMGLQVRCNYASNQRSIGLKKI